MSTEITHAATHGTPARLVVTLVDIETLTVLTSYDAGTLADAMQAVNYWRAVPGIYARATYEAGTR